MLPFGAEGVFFTQQQTVALSYSYSVVYCSIVDFTRSYEIFNVR